MGDTVYCDKCKVSALTAKINTVSIWECKEFNGADYDNTYFKKDLCEHCELMWRRIVMDDFGDVFDNEKQLKTLKEFLK